MQVNENRVLANTPKAVPIVKNVQKMGSQSSVNVCRKNSDQWVPTNTKKSRLIVANTRHRRGGQALFPPKIYSKSCSFQVILSENLLSFSKFYAQAPPLGSKLCWAPLTKILDPPLRGLHDRTETCSGAWQTPAPGMRNTPVPGIWVVEAACACAPPDWAQNDHGFLVSSSEGNRKPGFRFLEEGGESWQRFI